jgi:ATP-dependent Clp protease protease subunit
MFAIYDVMRVSREKCDIITYGLGKVMSAGVLILAAGTKGQRKIGKNCRVMIHSVIGGSAGSFHNLQNEMSEIKHIQSAYIKALSEETNMTVAYLKRMLNKKVNIYLSAEEAVELGIADIIV